MVSQILIHWIALCNFWMTRASCSNSKAVSLNISWSIAYTVVQPIPKNIFAKCPTLSLQLRCLGALGVRGKKIFPHIHPPPPRELASRLFHTLQSCMTDHIVWGTVTWNWCQGKHRCKVASFTGNSHVSCHKRQTPGTSDAVVSADGTLPRLVTSATKADILVKGPTNYWKGILNFLSYWLGNQQPPF